MAVYDTFEFGLEDDCPFCDIVRKGDCTFSDDLIVACFEPLNPVTDGHMLFIPTVHAEHRMRFNLGSISIEQVLYVAHQYAIKQESDFNLITSSGPSATQTIDHIHVHYVPRLENDGLKLPWTGQLYLREAPENDEVSSAE